MPQYLFDHALFAASIDELLSGEMPGRMEHRCGVSDECLLPNQLPQPD